MKYFKRMIGKNVYLSPLSMDDIDIYAKWMNDNDIIKNLNNVDQLINLLAEKGYIEKALMSGKKIFSIVKLASDKVIGICNLESIDYKNRRATVGIFIGEKDEHCKGYGTEALRLLLDFGFNYMNLHSIDLKVYEFNKKAIRCYEKVGFKEYGRRREDYILNGKKYNTICMDILEDEFRKSVQ